MVDAIVLQRIDIVEHQMLISGKWTHQTLALTTTAKIENGMTKHNSEKI